MNGFFERLLRALVDGGARHRRRHRRTISRLIAYEAAREHALAGEVFGLRCSFLSLDDLIAAKRASGRRKDAEMLAQLEVIREELRRLG